MRSLRLPFLALVFVAACGSSSTSPPLVAGTYSGELSTHDGLPAGLTGYPLSITMSGAGPAFTVTSWAIGGAIDGTSGTVTQSGGSVSISLVTSSSTTYCPSSAYSGDGSVDGSATGFTVQLTGPVCGGAGASATLAGTLLRQ